jgi:hypothetical protein
MPLPVHRKTAEDNLREQIKDDLAVLRAARSQQDDLKAALTEAHMNELLELLKEASSAGSVEQ